MTWELGVEELVILITFKIYNLEPKNVAMHQEHSSFSVSGNACNKGLSRG